MFIIHYINSSNKQEGSATVGSSEKVIEELKTALEHLKTLPQGAKIVIDYQEEQEQDNE